MKARAFAWVIASVGVWFGCGSGVEGSTTVAAAVGSQCNEARDGVPCWRCEAVSIKSGETKVVCDRPATPAEQGGSLGAYECPPGSHDPKCPPSDTAQNAVSHDDHDAGAPSDYDAAPEGDHDAALGDASDHDAAPEGDHDAAVDDAGDHDGGIADHDGGDHDADVVDHDAGAPDASTSDDAGHDASTDDAGDHDAGADDHDAGTCAFHCEQSGSNIHCESN